MQRVLVIGSGGAGKSTFAANLAERTGLPLVHLDRLYWRSGWLEPSKQEWADTVAQLIDKDRWVMDGNYGGTLEQRMTASDTIVFLDLPRALCLKRVIGRRIEFNSRARPDMTPGCPEQLSLKYLWWVWRYPATRRPGILQRLDRVRSDQRVVVLRSTREIERFFAAL